MASGHIVRMAVVIMVAGVVLCETQPATVTGTTPPPATQPAAVYAIHLDRHASAGDKQHLSVVASTSTDTTMTVDGQPPKTQSHVDSFTLDGVVEVLDTDALAQPCKVRILVEKFVQTHPGHSAILKPGTAITVDSGGADIDVQTDGEELPKTIGMLVALGSGLQNGKGVRSNGQVFGTNRPQSVGGSWPVNGDLIAHDLSRAGMPALAADVHGTARLADVVDIDGQKCLKITTDTTIQNVAAPLPGAAQGAHLLQCDMRIRASCFATLDPQQPLVAQGFLGDVKMVASRPLGGGKEARVDVLVSQKIETHYAPLGAGAVSRAN